MNGVSCLWPEEKFGNAGEGQPQRKTYEDHCCADLVFAPREQDAGHRHELDESSAADGHAKLRITRVGHLDDVLDEEAEHEEEVELDEGHVDL